jgi:ribonuclease-3
LTFHDPALLEQAFVHRSYVNENRKAAMQDNERLEYLGDAVLELAITEHLFHLFPEKKEGELTSLRSALVRKEHLSSVAKTLKLGTHLKLSHGEEVSGGREKDYLLANALEAIIGAMYLDQGYGACQSFLTKHLLPGLDAILKHELHIDPKSAFQEFTQEELKITPRYEVLSQTGPDHDKTFTVAALLGEKLIAKGKGSSKQKAEEDAAKAAIAKLRKQYFPISRLH